MQLYLTPVPERENTVQNLILGGATTACLPDGESKTAYNCANRFGCIIILRWRKANRLISSFTGRAPICSRFTVRSTMTHNEEREALTCGDGAHLFVMNLTLRWLPIRCRALLVDLPV